MTSAGSPRVLRSPPLGVILTAGQGTRLQPLTPALPKPLVPLLNRPLIDHGIETITRLGLRDIAVVVGPEDHQTAERARRSGFEGARVEAYVQRAPNGSGDAVASVGDALADRVVVVLSVDTVLRGIDARPLDRFLASGADASLILSPVEDARSFGVAILRGDRVVDLEEKPAHPRSNLAVVGVWMLAPAAVERVRRNPVINAKQESDLTATVGALVAEGEDVRGWEFDGEWLDAGTLSGLLHAQSRLLHDLRPRPPQATESELNGVVAAGDGCFVAGSHLRGPVLLGHGVQLDGAALEQVVVGDGAVLRNVRLRRALVAPGAHLVGGDYEDVVVTPEGEAAGPGAL